MRRVTGNLGPAEIHKTRPTYDLPLALRILLASSQEDVVPPAALYLGEVSPDVQVRHTAGVLPMVATAREAGLRTVFVSEVDATEAAVVDGIEVLPVASLSALVAHQRGDGSIALARRTVVNGFPADLPGMVAFPRQVHACRYPNPCPCGIRRSYAVGEGGSIRGMKYFVTGATGFVGGRVARLLREDGHEVVALARSPERARDLVALGIDVRAGDITDRDSLREPMRDVDGVFHLAAWYEVGPRDNRKAEAINVEGTRNVLTLMRELGIPGGVYTSTLAVFSDTHGRLVDESYLFTGRHLSEYDRTKWLAHYEVALPMMREGLPLVIVQPGTVYGPGDTSALGASWERYLTRTLPAVPRQTGFCWGHIDDVARGHLLAMDRGTPGEAYIIAGPPHTWIEAIALAERTTGVPGPRLHPSPAAMKAASRMAALVEKVVPLPPEYSSEALRVMAGVTYWGDNRKARQALGFTVRPLDVGLPDLLRHEMRRLGMAPPAGRIGS